MKQAIFTLALTMMAGAAYAQQPSQEKLPDMREKKLAADFFKKATWITDFAKAKEEAKKSDKPIFAYFTRSFAD